MDFKEQKEYIKENRKIDMNKFNRVSDITNMVDFINNEVERKNNDRADNEIHEISKFLARTIGRKMFFLKGKS